MKTLRKKTLSGNVQMTTLEVNSKYVLDRTLKIQGGLAAIIKKL